MKLARAHDVPARCFYLDVPREVTTHLNFYRMVGAHLRLHTARVCLRFGWWLIATDGAQIQSLGQRRRVPGTARSGGGAFSAPPRSPGCLVLSLGM